MRGGEAGRAKPVASCGAPGPPGGFEAGASGSAGVTGVKVDCQAGVGMAGSAANGGPQLAQLYHHRLEQSVQHYFPGNHCINCMCHSTENIYRCACPSRGRALGGVALPSTRC
jgi:Raffinose synthase or seed imbibition protein Sip1